MPNIQKSDWQAYCDRISKNLVGKRAEIEVASLRLGDQIEAAWIPLIGITYDPADDIIVMGFEGLEHMIQMPRVLETQEGASGLESLAVVDESGTRHLLKLKEPLTDQRR